MKKLYSTSRLILKVLEPEESCRVLNFYTEGREVFDAVEEVKPPAFYTGQYHKTALSYEKYAFENESYMRYYIFCADDSDTIIGTVSFSHIMKGVYNSCIIGYKFLPRFQKQGYATEAVSRLIEAIFTENGIHRIEAFVLPDNYDSIRLLTRLGFKFEGLAESVILLRDGYTDHKRYALVSIQTSVPVSKLT